MMSKIIKATDLNSSPEFEDKRITTSGKTMRALLIFPPATHAVRAMYTFEENEDTGIGVKPPLGIMYVASYLKTHSQHEVKILDTQLLRLSEEQIRQEIIDYQPDIVGLSAWTEFWYDTRRCIQIVKEVNPSIHVTIGGPHAGIFPAVTLETSGCDSVIVGDGEIPFFWLVNSLSNDYKPSNLPGLHFKEHGAKRDGSLFYVHSNLDMLPHPIREMLPYRSYFSALSKSDFVTTMITSRGCPFHCTYCKLNFQKTISRSAENVLDEMELIAGLGIKDIEIYDDTFTWSRQRLIEICKGMVDRKLKFNWAIRDRVSNPTPETMAWLAKAGLQRIHFGIESGSAKTIKTIKKGITIDQAKNAVRLAKEAGIEVLTYFMLGLPGENLDDMRQTIEFAKELDPDYTTFSVTVPYAGTEMYQEGLSRGIIPVDYWLEYARNPVPNFVIPFFWEEYLNKEQLLRIRDEATRSFYFRPKYILKQIRHVTNPREFIRKNKMAWGLLQATVFMTGKDRKLYGDSTN